MVIVTNIIYFYNMFLDLALLTYSFAKGIVLLANSKEAL